REPRSVAGSTEKHRRVRRSERAVRTDGWRWRGRRCRRSRGRTAGRRRARAGKRPSGPEHHHDPGNRTRGPPTHRRDHAIVTARRKCLCSAAMAMTKTASGLQYDDTKPGTGNAPARGQTCVMHYTGWLWVDGAKGAKFDSSLDRGQPFSFPLGQGRVIKGWDEGVATMNQGGKRTLLIPPELG